MKEVICCEDCKYLGVWDSGYYECQYWGTSIDITDGCTKGKKGVNCENVRKDCGVKMVKPQESEVSNEDSN